MTRGTRLNLGSGNSYIEGWVNVDSNPTSAPTSTWRRSSSSRCRAPRSTSSTWATSSSTSCRERGRAASRSSRTSSPKARRLGGRSRHAGDLRRVRRGRDHQLRAERPVRVLLRAAVAPRVVPRRRDRWPRSSTHAGYRDVQPIDPRHVGAGVLEGRSRIVLADRGARGVPASSVASSEPVDIDLGAPKPLPVAVDEVLLNRIRKLRAEVDALRAATKADAVAEVEVVPAVPAVLAVPEPPFDPGWVPKCRSSTACRDRWCRSRAGCCRTGAVSAAWRASAWNRAWVGREYVERLRHEWVRAGLRRPGTPTYERWCQVHDAGWQRLAEHRLLSDDVTNPLKGARRRGPLRERRRSRPHAPESGPAVVAALARPVRRGDVSGASAVRQVGDDRIEFRAARARRDDLRACE